MSSRIVSVSLTESESESEPLVSNRLRSRQKSSIRKKKILTQYLIDKLVSDDLEKRKLEKICKEREILSNKTIKDIKDVVKNSNIVCKNSKEICKDSEDICKDSSLNICISYKNKTSNERCNHKTTGYNYLCGIHKRCKKPRFFISPEDHFKKYLKYHYYLIESDYIKLKKGYEILNRLKINYFINKNYQKKKKSLIEMLDESYSYFLLGGESSWSEIPFRYIYKIKEGEYWNIKFLLKHFTQQINHCNMSEPSPQYPSSPMTRVKYTIKEMRTFYNHVKKIGLKIHPSLNLVLNMNLDKIYKKQEKEDKKAAAARRFPRDYFKKYLTDKLTISMRFSIINNKDSQSNYIGYWVNKRKKLSDFEKLYREWNNMAPFVYSRNSLVQNPDRVFFSQILDACVEERHDLNEYYE